MKTKSIIRSYYIISALTSGSMAFIMGVYSNFLRSALHDEFMVNMVNVVYFTVIMLCEIPTGLFADLFGRKTSFVISCFLEVVSMTIYGLSKSFGGFAIAEAIGALGRTFASGAFTAWLVDSLEKEGEKHNLLKIFTRRSLISSTVMIIMAGIGGYVGDKGLNLPFFCGGFLYLVTGIVATIIIKEGRFERNKLSAMKILAEIKAMWHKSLTFTKNDRNFRFVLMISAVQMFAVMAPNMEWQKVFKDLGFNNSYNGIVGGLITLAIVTGTQLSNKLGYLVRKEKNQIAFIQISTGLCIALTVSFMKVQPVLIFFFLHEISRGMSGPIIESFSQKCISSPKERATLSSFGSMVGHFGGALGLLVSGLIAKHAGIKPAWIVSGSILIIATLAVVNSNKKNGD